jgi:hypothetical protein
MSTHHVFEILTSMENVSNRVCLCNSCYDLSVRWINGFKSLATLCVDKLIVNKQLRSKKKGEK